ncbi:hypothetical protein PACTADRAFT_75189 [Pachysolen tannophilus NRRL Y-2460]|uniref:Uncharacterized protein n=1 Tax=Pachysolen tannophilus NRRL Y-2460 TaxID=669874 RepID=A0A1E4TW71_PACTA|nr:hypothetical protein PACTADRAFT_75189 [Pachysolen tannophilus NRRL Y-2460]
MTSISETAVDRNLGFGTIPKEVICGVTAGSITTFITHPLDLIKIRLQLDEVSKTQSESFNKIFKDVLKNSTDPTSNKLKINLLMKDLYRGIIPNLIGNTTAWGFYFMFYRIYKDLTHKVVLKNRGINNDDIFGKQLRDNQLSSHHYLISAFAAGFTTSAITNPLWVLKTRILSTSKNQPGAYQSILDGIRQIIATEGIFGFWKGLIPSLFGVAQGSLQFSIYDTLKHKVVLTETSESYSLNVFQSLYLSSISKIISSFTLYPFQVIRSRLQGYGNKSTMSNIIKHTYINEGLKGFYKGILANIIRVLPATWITFTVYERTKDLLKPVVITQ